MSDLTALFEFLASPNPAARQMDAVDLARGLDHGSFRDTARPRIPIMPVSRLTDKRCSSR